jgi:hypothetical protein
MGLYVLSTRSLASSVSTDSLFELEDILVRTCHAQLLAPTARQITQWSYRQSAPVSKLANKFIHRTIGFYKPINAIERSPYSPHVLLIIALNGDSLKMLSSIPQWRQKFDRVAAYVFDAWELACYPAIAHQIDHLFVPMPEVIDTLQAFLKVPVSLLPFGSDVLTHGSDSLDRPIDLLSYGRIPDSYQRAFGDFFNQPGSAYLYYRSTPRRNEEFPPQPYACRRDLQDTMQLYNLLRHAKLSIAFDTMYPGMRSFPYPFVTLRWFQSGAAGCGIVGKRPTTPLANQLLDWQDATIDLPDDPEASIDLIQSLLADQPRLHAMHQRNYRENLARHDWRYRIEQMLTMLGIDLPDQLINELLQLRRKLQAISDRPSSIASKI